MKFLSAVFSMIIMLGLFTTIAMAVTPAPPCDAACTKESNLRSNLCHEKYTYLSSAYIKCMRPVRQAEGECMRKCQSQERLERKVRFI